MSYTWEMAEKKIVQLAQERDELKQKVARLEKQVEIQNINPLNNIVAKLAVTMFEILEKQEEAMQKNIEIKELKGEFRNFYKKLLEQTRQGKTVTDVISRK